MRLTASTTPTPPPAAPPPESQTRTEAVEAKIALLRSKAAELHREHLELDAAGAHPTPPATEESPQQVAKRWLNGFGGGPLPASKDARLYEVIRDRNGLALALEDLDRQLFAARADASREYMAENMHHWHAIQLRRVRALLELNRANRAAAEFRRAAVAIGPGTASLPADRVGGLFSEPIVDGPIYRYLAECVRAGIVTAEEIAQ